ncbi:integrase domain-containing protein [Vibrio breoganii]|uniref:integrase domain-containing protein n=1 Tax=Vibrio breoganii TaxID=553239 RepID=UPI000C819142|nr:integrase domain-containing protein [Vibrio breoganii]PMK32400.1 hypothetical protein BCU03_04985 [Vibrio breoganii]
MKKLFNGHLPKGPRNLKKLNFGLGSREPVKALINASLENTNGMKNNTHKSRMPACYDFVRYLHQETDIKRLEDITKADVMLYGESLRERFESEGDITASTARDYLSSVNVCLAQARGDEQCRVRASKDLGFPYKTGIATYDGSTSFAQHQAIVHSCSASVSVTASLQRAFGLRFREAALLDSEKALVQAIESNAIEVSRGTKGGQPRTVPIENLEQIKALEQGASLQRCTEHDNATPSHLSFKAFQTKAWRETKAVDATYRSHGERKHFACEYYRLHIGALPPVQAGVAHGQPHFEYLAKQLSLSISEVKHRDKTVRLALSKVLGHHRVGITNAYLG